MLDPPAVAHVADPEDHRPAALMSVVLLLIERRNVASDHHLHQALGRQIGALQGADIAAVAQHADAVGEIVNLAHAVADVDDGQPVVAQLSDQREQFLGLARRERGGRLVHHQDARAGMQGARDLDQLPLGHRQRTNEGARRKGDAKPRQDRSRGLVHRPPVDKAVARQLGAEKDILRHREVRRQRQLLIDDGDAQLPRRLRTLDVDRLAGDPDLTAWIGPVGAGQHLHEGGLASPVFPHQGMDLAGPDIERDALQHPQIDESLRDMAHLKDRRLLRSHGHQSLPSTTTEQPTAMDRPGPGRNVGVPVGPDRVQDVRQ